jgi:long-subunit fatty acid transport protein
MPLDAQTSDFGIWVSAGVTKKLWKWNLDASGELRLKENTSQVDRMSLQFNASYHINKPLSAGIGYEFIYYHDSKYADYQPRQRYMLFIQGKQKFGHFSFSLREKIQRTIKDESDRLKENGDYDNYKINPEWVWRNRLALAYNIPRFPVNPAFSFESFYQLNNPDGNKFEKLRFTLALSFKPGKHHEFKVYGLIDQKINVDNPYKRFILGTGYTFSF